LHFFSYLVSNYGVTTAALPAALLAQEVKKTVPPKHAMEILKTIILYILWCTGGIMLVAYPAILVANVMSFAAPGDNREKTFLIWLKALPFRILLITTTLYPFLLWFCIRASRQSHSIGQFRVAVLWSLPPVLITAIVGWLLFGKQRRRK
jgi:hypothetical protein